MQTLNDFQKFLGDIFHLWHIIGVGPDDLVNLNKTLDGDKDLNSPRELSAEEEITLIGERDYRRHMWIVWIQILTAFWPCYPQNIPLQEF